MALRKKFTKDGSPVIVQSAIEDGSGKNIENTYAKQDGYYAKLGSGTSDVAKAIESDRQIDNPEVACPPIVFGTTGGEAEITSGFSKLESISGNTIKWGQLLDGTQCSVSSGAFTYDASTHLFHYVKDNSEGSSYNNTVFIFPAQRISKHIYYVRFRLVSGNLGISHLFIVNSSQQNLLVNPILSPLNTTDQYTQFVMSIPAGAVGDFYCTLEMFDLTNIYGLEQEISDAEEFDRVYPNYYPYSPNVILSAKPYQLISRQKNQCSGLDQFIRVVPNTEYELSGITAGGILEEYDADKTLINTTSNITSTLDITLSANTYYVKIKATTSNAVMFYITWGVYNEPYEPYEEESVDLPNIELLRVYDTKDEAYQAGGGIRRIGVIDLGTLTVFDYRSELHTYRIQIPHMRKPNRNNETWKHTNCAEYDVNNTNYTLSLSNMSFCTIENVSGIYIKNDACSTAQEMKSALSGVLLYYILDTPTEITTEENPGWQEFVKTNNFGTIEFTTNPQQVPQVLQSYFIKYTANLVEFIDSAYVKTEGDGNNIALQSDLNVVESDVEGLKNGSIPAKLADNLTPYSEDSGVYQSIPFNSQGTGCGNGETQVDTGSYALVKEIRGNSIRYNQLVRNGDFADGTTGWSATYGTMSVSNNELTYTVSQIGTIGQPVNRITRQNIIMTKGHNYLLRFMVNCPYAADIRFVQYSSELGTTVANRSNNAVAGWNDFYAIINYTNESTTADFRLCPVMTNSSQVGDVFKFKQVSYTDLTKWFNGNDMIPSYLIAHPETFLRYYDGALDYDVDTIKFANATQIISTGRQQWDEEWEVGTINSTTGKNMTDAGRIRSKNFIELIPATKYYIRNNSSASAFCQTFYYDTNKQFISSKSDEHNEVLRPPESARYLRISPYAAYGNTYTNDITISLYYDGESGYDEYYPYEVLQTIDIDTSKLRRARNAYDSQLPNGLSVQRIKSVDLGTLTWHKAGTPTEQSGGKGYYYFSDPIADSAGWSFSTLANLLVEGYDVALFSKVRWINYTPATPTDNSVITIYNNPKSVNIYNPAFDTPEMTVEEVTNALSGVILYYELSEPIITVSTPYAEALKIDDFGSTKNVSTNGVPQGNLIFYPVDYKAYVDTLVNHTDGDATSIALKGDLDNKQDIIDTENKLSADLVDDSSTEHKFVTQEEKDEIARSANLNLKNGTGNGSIKLDGNTVTGDKSTALGQNNTVQADRAFASGGGNIIRYDGQTQNGYMGFAIGQNNYVSGWSASAIGEQLEAKNGGQLVVGEANLNRSDNLFEVGNGEITFTNVSSKPTWQQIINNPIYYISNGSDGYTKITENNYIETQYANLSANEIYVFDDTGRSNAFEVSEDGVARSYGTPSTNNDLIPKGYADTHYGQSVKTITVALSQIAGAGNDSYTTAQFIRFRPTQEQAAILANNDYSIIKLDLTALGNSAPAPYVWLRRNTVIELPNPIDTSSTIPAYQFTAGGEQFWYENYQTDIAIKSIGNGALVFSPDLGTADITLLNISIPTLYETLGKIPTNIGNGTINGTLTQKNLSYDQMILDFEPNMVAYVSYIGAGVSSPTSEQLIALLNSDKTNPYVAAILGNYTFEQYCAGFLAGTGSIQPGVSNKTAIDALVVEQLSDRWNVSSSDDLSNTFGRASDGAVAIGFKNKVYSPAAVTFGFSNQAGDEGYPSETIGAIATGFGTKALGNQAIAGGYGATALGNQSVAIGLGDLIHNKPLINKGNQSVVFGAAGSQAVDDYYAGADKDNVRLFNSMLLHAGVIDTELGDSDRFYFDGIHTTSNNNFALGGYIHEEAGPNNVVFHGAISEGSNNIIAGNQLVVNGNNNAIFGLINEICYSSGNILSGAFNTLYGQENQAFDENIVGGFGNTVRNSDCTFVAGAKNFVVNADSCLVVGSYLKLSNNPTLPRFEGKTVLGTYNIGLDSAIFEIGNGNSNVRNNAFEVTKSGIARAYGTISGDNDLTPKSYVDTADALKLDKTNSANKIYGTDSNGAQTTYDKSSFGQVDDVRINNVSIVANKIANITIDSALNVSSDNAVKNSVVTAVINTKSNIGIARLI